MWTDAARKASVERRKKSKSMEEFVEMREKKTQPLNIEKSLLPADIAKISAKNANKNKTSGYGRGNNKEDSWNSTKKKK